MRSFKMKSLILATLVAGLHVGPLAGCALETGSSTEQVDTSAEQGLTDGTSRNPDQTRDQQSSRKDKHWQSSDLSKNGWNRAPGDPVPWNPPKDPEQPK